MSVTFEDLLARDGHIVYRTRGTSMEPMLRQNRDLVVIRVPAARLDTYDVALYKRGSAYVLHRVIGLEKKGYLIRGDNTFTVEHVPFDAVIGVLSSFRRKGKEVDVKDRGYRLYVRFWCAIYPLRALFVRCRRFAVRVARKTGLLPVLKKLLRRG